MANSGIGARWAGLGLQRRMLQALSPAQIRQALRKKVFGRISGAFSKRQRKAGLYLVRGIEKLYGSDRAHSVFWRLWPSVTGWSSTQSRLRLLADENPDAIPKFVELALRLNKDPVVLLGLARNPHSRAALADCLRRVTLEEGDPYTKVIQQRQQYAATFVAVVQLLLDDATAEALVAKTMRLHRVLTDAFLQIMYSAGTRTATPPAGLYRRGVMDSGFRNPVDHRLVIVEDYSDPQAMAQLFYGARQVTVLALTDLLGRADLSSYLGLGGVESIVVEHLRTRVSRFSQAYVENHEAARDAGKAVARALAAQPGLLSDDQQNFLAVALCDFVHFQCLKIAAVKALLEDPAFDHIAIGMSRQAPGSEYFRVLSGVREIATDARVELVSIARVTSHKLQFTGCLAMLAGRSPQLPTRTTFPSDMADVVTQVQEHADRIASRMAYGLGTDGDEVAPTDKTQVLMFTSNNAAYNPSTAAYAAALDTEYRLNVIHVGMRAGALRTELLKLGDRAGQITVRLIAAPLKDRWDATRRALGDVLWQVHAGLPPSAASHILRINADRIVSEVISPQLVALHAMDAWFARMQAASALPELVILAPARVPQIAAMAAVARKYGVPSLTLEAHGLNANYSRYLKVTSDYYGVVSDYFRKDAVNGFAIPQDRIAVIGTPRIVAKPDHDPQVAQAEARAMLTEDQAIPFGDRRGTISFFCQPSAWSHVALVWWSVLIAAQVLDLDVLLKTHPEETPTRRAAYLLAAEQMGLSAQVHVVTGAPTPIIAASDVVLTGYSAAALDAAVLQVPVICVTEGAVDYPVDQHAMIDAPLVRSTEELQARLAAILSDPVAARVHAMQFLAREHQFVEGPDNRLRALVADILARPASESIRPADSVARSVFLDSPHPIFPI